LGASAAHFAEEKREALRARLGPLTARRKFRRDAKPSFDALYSDEILRFKPNRPHEFQRTAPRTGGNSRQIDNRRTVLPG